MEAFKYIHEAETRKKGISNEKSPENRRRFFAALLLAAGIAEKPHEVQAAEVDPAMNWSDGIYALQHDVYTAETETAALYVNTNDGGEWVLPSKLERNTHSVNYSYNDIDLGEKMEQIKTACSFHTHPLEAGESVGFITDSTADTLRKEYESNETLAEANFPPSAPDVLLIYNDLGLDLHEPTRIIDAVVTPSGIWYMELDKDSSSYQEVSDARSYIRTLLTRINEIPESEIENKLTQFASERGMKPTKRFTQEELKLELFSFLTLYPSSNEIIYTTKILTMGEIEQYGKYIENGTAELIMKQNWITESQKEFVDSQVSEGDAVTSPSEGAYENLLNNYRKMGIEARYVSYENLKNEPPCAGAFYDGIDDEHRFSIDQEKQ